MLSRYSLQAEVVEKFKEVVDSPHDTTPYYHFKSTMQDRKSVSARRRLQQLLNQQELVERRNFYVVCGGF